MSTMTHTVPLRITENRFWIGLVVFVSLNVLAPILVHSIPRGGQIFLPLFIGTLLASRLGGSTLALAVAVLAPLVSHVLTGMPLAAMLPLVLAKSATLGLVAGLLSASHRKIIQITLPIIALAAMIIVGFAAERLMGLTLSASIQTIKISWPGMLIMIVTSVALWLSPLPGEFASKNAPSA